MFEWHTCNCSFKCVSSSFKTVIYFWPFGAHLFYQAGNFIDKYAYMYLHFHFKIYLKDANVNLLLVFRGIVPMTPIFMRFTRRLNFFRNDSFAGVPTTVFRSSACWEFTGDLRMIICDSLPPRV